MKYVSKHQLQRHIKYHALASKRFAVAHFITYGTNFPQYSMPHTNNSPGNHFTMQLMLIIDNLKSVTSHTASAIDLLLIKSLDLNFQNSYLLSV